MQLFAEFVSPLGVFADGPRSSLRRDRNSPPRRVHRSSGSPDFLAPGTCTSEAATTLTQRSVRYPPSLRERGEEGLGATPRHDRVVANFGKRGIEAPEINRIFPPAACPPSGPSLVIEMAASPSSQPPCALHHGNHSRSPRHALHVVLSQLRSGDSHSPLA